MPAIPLRPLDFGEVLDLAFGLFRRDYRLYMPLALVGLVPAVVSTAIPTSGSSDPEALAALFSDFATAALFVGLLGVGLLFSLMTWSALVAAMDARIGDRPVSIGASYSRALVLLPRLVGAAFLAFLVLMAAVVVVMIPSMLGVGLLAGGSIVANLVGALVVFLAMVGATGWWATHTYMLVPAVVVEERGPIRALGRSFRLVRGSRWRVFFVFAVTWFMSMTPTLAAYILAGSASAILESNPAEIMGPLRYWAIQMVGLGFQTVTTPLWIACTMVLYLDLKARSEGTDLQAAARAMAG